MARRTARSTGSVAATLHEKFVALGSELVMRPAAVLPKDERVDRDWYHIWLGMDLLGQMREVTMDFNFLTFSLK